MNNNELGNDVAYKRACILFFLVASNQIDFINNEITPKGRDAIELFFDTFSEEELNALDLEIYIEEKVSEVGKADLFGYLSSAIAANIECEPVKAVLYEIYKRLKAEVEENV